MAIRYTLHISIPFVLLITGSVVALDIDHVIEPLVRASVDMKSLTGNAEAAVNSSGGAIIDSKLLNLGVGSAGEVEGVATVDGKNLKGNLEAAHNIDAGGGLNIQGIADAIGGIGSKGIFKTNVDLKNLKSDIKLDQNSGIGGIITGDAIDTISGGVGSSVNLSGMTDLKKGISELDFSSDNGTDGRIRLPGKLGGLVYHIDDASEISSSINFSDLSQRSLQILKETNIVVNIDLPGDRLENINIEANPSIEITNPVVNLQKLGNLKLLTFADKFAKDMLAVTEFNMLTEANILDALSSGLEFAARLDILRALANQIGTIMGMPRLVERVRLVLADMVSILEALRRVKLLPDNVRSIGVALNNFDLSELKVELPQLEILSAAAEKPGLEGFGTAQQERPTTSPTDPLVEAGSLLSNFNMDEFLSLAHFGERVSNTALSAVSGLHNPTLVAKALAAGSASNIAGIATMIPTIASGVSRVAGINGNSVADALNEVVSSTGVEEVTNELLNSTPNELISNVAEVANEITNGNMNDVINTDIGHAVGDVLSNNNVLEDILNAAKLNDVLKGKSTNDVLKAAREATNAAVNGGLNAENLKVVSAPGAADIIDAAGDAVNAVLDQNGSRIAEELEDAINIANAGRVVNDILEGRPIDIKDALNVPSLDLDPKRLVGALSGSVNADHTNNAVTTPTGIATEVAEMQI